MKVNLKLYQMMEKIQKIIEYNPVIELEDIIKEIVQE